MRPLSAVYTIIVALISIPSLSAPLVTNVDIQSASQRTSPTFEAIIPLSDLLDTDDSQEVSSFSGGQAQPIGQRIDIILKYTYITPTAQEAHPEFDECLNQALNNLKAKSEKTIQDFYYLFITSETFKRYGPVQLRPAVPPRHANSLPQQLIVRLVNDAQGYRSGGRNRSWSRLTCAITKSV